MSKDLIPEPTVFMHEFLGTWEVIHNPDFNCTEFGTIKNAAGSTMLLQGRLARLVALMCRLFLWGLGYASAVVPAVLPRCSSAPHRTSSGEDAGEGRSIHRPTPKGAASNQGDGRNRYKGDMGVKSGNTSVSPPKHPLSSTSPNQRKTEDKPEVNRS